ncbi:MAG: ATP-binding protein [Actinobacteria bacterium]|nr:ATP-binding protein [Actinomycetota bacterium]
MVAGSGAHRRPGADRSAPGPAVVRSGKAPLKLPGMELAAAGATAQDTASRIHVGRSGINQWWLLVCDPPAARTGEADARTGEADARTGARTGAPPGEAAARTGAADALLDTARLAAGIDGGPSTVLARAAEAMDRRGDGPGRQAVFVRVELDVCGAWCTLSNAGSVRPYVVRRAGWIDVRGHESAPLGEAGPAPADDRAGLGPGDALVIVPHDRLVAADRAGERFADEALPEVLLDLVGRPSAEIADAVVAESSALASDRRRRVLRGGPVVVLRVPGDLGEDPMHRVVRATGAPPERLHLPGYPLGDRQPDLWSAPPAPPREARLRLAPTGTRLHEVRALLRRLLASWRLDDRVDAGDLELLATEVTTNAIRHAGTAATVIVRYTGGAVRVEVGDASSALPELVPPPPDAEGGRGMPLVEALASAWGVTPTRHGKRVWFEIGVPDTGRPRDTEAPEAT